MAGVIDTLGKAARHNMLLRVECGCGNTRAYLASDLMMILGGGIDPRGIRFRCGACHPRVTVVEVDRDRRPNITIWRPEKRDGGGLVWNPQRFR